MRASVRVWPKGQETSWDPQKRVVVFQANKMQAGKTIPNTGNSLCRRGKEEYGVSKDSKASNVARVEICSGVESWQAELDK